MEFSKERFWRIQLVQEYSLTLDERNAPGEIGETPITTLECKSKDAQGAVDQALAWIAENGIGRVHISGVACNNFSGELLKLYELEDNIEDNKLNPDNGLLS